MILKEAEIRARKLRKLINRYRYEYHVENKLEISPEALDSLKYELKRLEEEFPQLVTPDSPTQRVAGKPSKKFAKVEHLSPMLSLEDAFSKDDIRSWADRLEKVIPGKNFGYFAELKFDGLALSLRYRKGILEIGATRGDGRIGEDITTNVKTIESIPLKLELFGKRPSALAAALAASSSIEVRGEVLISKKELEHINRIQKRRGGKIYANSRNLAAGTLRQLDPLVVKERHLDFFAYDLLVEGGPELHSEEHQVLREIGFKTDFYAKRLKSVEDVLNFHKEIEKIRDEYPYEIDGIVVAVDDNRLHSRAGVVGKAPRGSVAYKFSPKEATARILDIKVQLGRTGVLTPVAIIEPVKIGGATISRATLHNEDEIKRLGLKIGDTVIVGRAGDVIPDIKKVLVDLRTGKEKDFHFPRHCPVCSKPVKKDEGGVLLRCFNKKCPRLKQRWLYHFAGKSAFDIEGLGPKTIDVLLDQNLIQDAADLFLLKEGDIAVLERYGDRSAVNIVSSIASSRKISLERFLVALGILHVGEETARDLAEHFGSLEKIISSSKEEILQIKNIGDIVAKSVFDYFRDEFNAKLIKKLKTVGVEIEKARKKKPGKFSGITFVFTGELDTMSRDAAKAAVRALDGDASETVSGSTDYVVLGSLPGSKYEKAKKLGIKIIKEKEFLKLIG